MKDYNDYEEFKINQSTLRLFKRYLIIDQENANLKDESLSYGIVLDQPIDKELFDEIIKQYGIDGYALNQTFHKSLEKVAQSELIDLYVQQLVHYFTTYGYENLGITDGTVYIPNEKLEVPVFENGINLTFISQINEEELKQKITELATNKLPLSRQTVSDLLTLSDFLIESIDIEDVTNKELKTALYNKYDIVPKNNVEFVRFLVNKLTGNSMLIKDKRTIFFLSNFDVLYSKALEYLKQYQEKYGLEPLSEIFNRYKKIFVALKRDPEKEGKYYNEKVANLKMTRAKELNHIINRLYKLSLKHHKPFIDENYINHIMTFVNNIQYKENREEILMNYISKKTIWEIIKVYDYLKTNSKTKAYKIRNGKVFVEKKNVIDESPSWVINVFEEYLINRIRENIGDKTIYFPNNISYALPQSEKQFVGNIPFNSVINLPKEGFIVGIHWTNLEPNNKENNYSTEEYRVDLDLKLFSNKYSISWNTNYRSENAKLLYSGDMTNAPITTGGASEFIFVDPTIEPTVMTFRVNNYTMNNHSSIPFEIIIATADKADYLKNANKQNYVVNPNNIIAKFPCQIEKGQAEYNIGILVTDPNEGSKFIITNLSTSNLPVSKNNILDEYFREYMVQHSDKQEYLKSLLMKADSNLSIRKTVEKLIPCTTIKTGDENSYSIITIPNTELDTKYKEYKILEQDIFKKEEVPVDIDLSLENINKTTIIDMFKSR